MSDSYHDWDGESLTRSQLYTFRKNPRDFYNRYVLGLAQPRSKALVFGSAFHALTLEGREVFDKDFVETFERPAAPRDPRNKLCAGLFEGAQFESVAEGIDYETGIPLRCKVDIWTNQGFCCDLKSHSGDLGDSWDRAIMDYGYHFQAAFYRTCTSTDRFPFLVVQKSRNPDAMVAELDDEEAALGQKVLRAALDRFAVCLDAHRAAYELEPGPERNLAIDAAWPGIGMAQTDRRVTRFPKWFYDKELRYVSK